MPERRPTGQVDAAIIGGGPAGCTAARLLTQFGHTVALITRPPPAPALAESIPPSAQRILRHVGWLPAIDAAGFLRASGNTVMWGASAPPPLGDPARQAPITSETQQALYQPGSLGFQVDRAVLNSLLLDGLRERCRVERATVLSAERGSLRYRRPDGLDAELRARWILDCSGRTGVIARRGWRRGIERLRTLAIAGIWERTGGWRLADPTHTVVESHRDGWVWSVPTSLTRRHVTVMVDPRLTNVASAASLRDAYRDALRLAPGISSLTRDAALTGEPFARDASPYTAQRMAAEDTLLVGDSATFVDPLSSFGIKKAVASAWLAAVVVRTALEDPAMSEQALAFYEGRERSMYESLERQRGELAKAALAAWDAAGAEGASRFWETRAGAEAALEELPNEDIERLRRDPDIQSAFEHLKRLDCVSLSVSDALERVQQPTVRGDRIVLETQLRAPGLATALRFVRNVDLVTLLDLAPSATQVGELYAAYSRVAAPVPLPDFLGALSLLVGKRLLLIA